MMMARVTGATQSGAFLDNRFAADRDSREASQPDRRGECVGPAERDGLRPPSRPALARETGPDPALPTAIVCQVLDALEAVCRVGLVRRDLEPGNVPLEAHGHDVARRITVDGDILSFIHRRYADTMLEARNSRRSSLTGSSSHHRPIVHYRPRSESAAEFLALAQEVLEP
ncbi:MAG: hypothetical protein HY814_04930 [Candidatus Riflebacteria bacterium]|nr:hypothetical protein [Candidatus Riflebacteria bacterium]